MDLIVHHQPLNPSGRYYLHAWDTNTVWDVLGTPSHLTAGAAQKPLLDFSLTNIADLRRLQFMYHIVDPASGNDVWEPGTMTRRIRRRDPGEIWTYDGTLCVSYPPYAPFPTNATLKVGDVITVNAVTRSAFAGGGVHVWNPWDSSYAPETFPQTSRSDDDVTSTFSVMLRPGTIEGFCFKLVGPGDPAAANWESDTANRVWRPGDGRAIWVKSGQVSVRHRPLKLHDTKVQVLLPAGVSPPTLTLNDPAEGFSTPLSLDANADTYSPAGPLFTVASYVAQSYRDAVYELWADPAAEGSQIVRPFPADPLNLDTVSRFVLGADGYLVSFPPAETVTLAIEPCEKTSFGAGLTVSVATGSAPAFETVPATGSTGATLIAKLAVLPGISHSVVLTPTGRSEPKPYDWIDTRRFFTPPAPSASLATPSTWYTTEGVYGLTSRGPTVFAEPPGGRAALMAAAFPPPVGGAANLFGAAEMPYGATFVDGNVYFVVHAPHAVWAAVVLVDETAAGGPVRRAPVPMKLTDDGLYWWCAVPADQAPGGTRYRLLLNDDLEVMDPAARLVCDSGNFNTQFNDDPKDPGTSWSVVFDPAPSRSLVQSQPWDTITWDAILAYQIHPSRFTDLQPGPLASFDLLADELKPSNRLGKTGYLLKLPVTALQLMPIHEFSSTNSWGYNPAFFFTAESHYGGPAGLARFITQAHSVGKAVLFDLVYNHMNDSPLTRIAIDVYRNGDAWGDRINNAHPMVKEFFRQATVYIWQTFAPDGFRFDASSTILDNMGWDFLSTMRWAVRTAASASGKRWPLFLGENDDRYWNMTNPAWSILDGQWDTDEVNQLGQAAFDPWGPAVSSASGVKSDIDVPATWAGWPFSAATRYGESHDSVSGGSNMRIAMRPPYRQGLQMAKAVGAAALLSKGVPMLFMGEEVGETRYFSLSQTDGAVNPMAHDLPPETATDNTRVLAWFTSLMGLRNDPGKGLRGDASAQSSATGFRTVAFTCGHDARLFVVVTFGTPNQQQNSARLGLPGPGPYKEIFNSSWPVFQVEFEPERTNGGPTAQIYSGQVIQLPYAGAVVLERY